jgi:hypothetical protein
MHIERLNRPVFELDDAHPAKRFLSAFIACRTNCVGRELAPPGQSPIDQEWTSASDGRDWTFSAFAYGYLSFDIELDGLITGAQQLTESERWALGNLPRFQILMGECARAAKQRGNADCLELVDEVVAMLKLWDEYLQYRKRTIAVLRA